jgi:hypothetical protein
VKIREEYRLREFKKGIHRITFEFRGKEVTSSWRELERNGRYDIHSRNIFTMILSRQIRAYGAYGKGLLHIL